MVAVTCCPAIGHSSAQNDLEIKGFVSKVPTKIGGSIAAIKMSAICKDGNPLVEVWVPVEVAFGETTFINK